MTRRAHAGSASRPLAAALAGVAWLLAAPAAAQEALVLECDDDRLGGSTLITFADSSPEFQVEEAIQDCDAVPGTWSAVSLVDETDDSTVDAAVSVSSDAQQTLEVRAEAALEVEDDFLDFGSVALGAEAEALFDTPESEDDDVLVDVVVELEREGDFEDDELSIAIEGPSTDFDENLEDLPNGVTRFPVELEPDEEYVMFVTFGGLLDETSAAAWTLRVRLETTPVPEPSAVALACTGAAVLCAARRRFHAEKKLQPRGRA